MALALRLRASLLKFLRHRLEFAPLVAETGSIIAGRRFRHLVKDRGAWRGRRRRFPQQGV